MTKETLTKAKRVASHLNSGELNQLSTWAQETAREKYIQEGIFRVKSYPEGTKLVLGNVSGFPQFSGQTVVLSSHGRKYFVVHLLNVDGSADLAHGLKIPYSHYGTVKGPPTPENVSTAKGEVEINRTLAPMLNGYIKDVLEKGEKGD